MKKSKFLIICVTVLVFAAFISGCKSKPSAELVELKKANEQLATNLEMYETIWDEIVNQQDLEQINETNFDKNITLITSPENIVGIENFKAYYKNFLSGFSNVTFSIVDVLGQGDKIVKHWNFKGKHTGDFFGIPATGREVNIDGVTLVKMKDGKIKQEQDFFDNLVFMQQLGIISK